MNNRIRFLLSDLSVQESSLIAELMDALYNQANGILDGESGCGMADVGMLYNELVQEIRKEADAKAAKLANEEFAAHERRSKNGDNDGSFVA